MHVRHMSLKDQCILLGAGLVCAVLAWAFWHYAGADGGAIPVMLAFISVVLDNRRLRARLRAYQDPH